MSAAAQDGAQDAHDDGATYCTRDSAVTRACHALGVLLALGQVLLVHADAMAGINHRRVIRAAWCRGAAGKQRDGGECCNEPHESSRR